MIKVTPERTTEEEAKRLSKEHWSWLEPLLRMIYTGAMEHGYKHGIEAVTTDEYQ
ncbi:hypothetical protein KKH23_05600 [Patescibacteria group bacterium]|uniref:Uncharacterized protein n=1 Tax=viral metagenome TaxID=1070528 RepID=A0A6M3M3J8_9ZZZZ|nr:hypothetical protein [Patescibacteria group bacterium]